MEAYEQREHVHPLLAWLMVIAFSASLIAWALLMHELVEDVPRAWDFGQLPSTPGESPYSTEQPPPHQRPRPLQLQPLPEARAMPDSDRETGQTP